MLKLWFKGTARETASGCSTPAPARPGVGPGASSPSRPTELGGETGAAPSSVRILPYAGETDARRMHAGDWLF